MAALQHLTRILLSAGGAPDSENKDGGIFVYGQDNKLVTKVWDGKQWDQDEALIATDASPATSAVYFVKQDGTELVYYLSTSSTIRCRKSVEGEWSDDSSFPSIKAHAESKIHGKLDFNGDVTLYFQDASGHIVQIDSSKSWAQTLLPVQAVVGTPISVTNNGPDSKIAIFYISSTDSFIHSVLVDNFNTDRIVAKIAFPEKLHRFLVSYTSDGNVEVYILTEKHTIFQLTTTGGKEERHTVGKVDKDGKFVPGDSAENCWNPCWPPPCWRCGCSPCRCYCWCY